MDADNIDEEDAAPRTARVERPPSARLALLMSIGKVGPASGTNPSPPLLPPPSPPFPSPLLCPLALHAWSDHDHS